jgi:hypothetical protein
LGASAEGIGMLSLVFGRQVEKDGRLGELYLYSFKVK